MLFRRLQSEKGKQTFSQYYTDFNRVYEELEVLFPTSQDVKNMQKQWDLLVVLMFLGSLPSKYTLAHPQVIDSSAIDSLFEILWFLAGVFPEESKNPIRNKSPQSTLAIQHKQFIVNNGGRGGCFWW